MADAIVINKADGDNLKKAMRAMSEFERALQLYPPKSNGWIPQVRTCSARDNQGITELWELIIDYVEMAKENSYFNEHRKEQNTNWLMQTVNELLKTNFYHHPKVKNRLQKLILQVGDNKLSPFKAAELLIEAYREELK